MIRPAGPLALVLVLTIALAAPAGGAPRLVASVPLAPGGPDAGMLGAQTLVATRLDDSGAAVRSYAPGARAVTLARLEAHQLGETRLSSFALAVSPTRLLALAAAYTPGYKGSEGSESALAFGAPLGHPLKALAERCAFAPTLDEGAGHVASHTAIAVAGDVIAYDDFGCVIVEDLDTGTSRVIALPETLEPVIGQQQANLPTSGLLAVAGRLLAYRRNTPGAGSAAVVLDIDSGQELYEVPLSGPSATFALEANGTLVIASEPSCRVEVAGTSAPAPQPLGIPGCAIRAAQDGRVLLTAPSGKHERELAWSSLAAPALHPLAATGVGGALEAPAAAIDESEALYAISNCYGARVYRAPLEDPGRPSAPPVSCPARVAGGGIARLGSSTLSTRLRCPLGCESVIGARLGTRRELRAGKGSQLEAEAPEDIALPAGGSTRVELSTEGWYPPIEGLARRIRRGARLYLRLELETRTPSGHTRNQTLTIPIRLGAHLRRRHA